MKRSLLVLLCVAFSSTGWAQHELPVDTLHRSFEPQEVRHYGDYLLDMRLMNLTSAKVMRPSSLLTGKLLLKDYNRLFSLNPDLLYSQTYTNMFSRPLYYGYYDGIPFGRAGAPDFMNTASFTLKNGMHINTYGQYDIHGNLMPGVNVLPWQKHDFKAAFELKSANGAFGIRVEVSREANPFPY